MDIYHYHPVTKEYLGAGVADPSPLEPGVWLIPAQAVTIAPPAATPGHAVVFENGAWASVEDHRGTVMWKPDGAEVTIENLGPLPSDLLKTKPPEPPAPKIAPAAPLTLYEKLKNVGLTDDEMLAMFGPDKTATIKAR